MSLSFRYIVARLLVVSVVLVVLTNCGRAIGTATPAPSVAPHSTASVATLPPTLYSPTTTPDNTLPPALRWLAGIPCRVPCWEQLIPGKTTISEAKTRLSQLDSVTSLQQGAEYDPAVISWQWTDYAYAGGNIYYYSKAPAFAHPPLNVIFNISLVLDQPLTFQEIIAQYGEPSHIQLAANYTTTYGMVYYFSVVYLDNGFLLRTEMTDFSHKPSLERSTSFQYVVLFEPGTTGFDHAIEPFFPIREPSQLLVPWGGFDIDINTYCREIRPAASKKGCQ